jgi:hypothetical protein
MHWIGDISRKIIPRAQDIVANGISGLGDFLERVRGIEPL